MKNLASLSLTIAMLMAADHVEAQNLEDSNFGTIYIYRTGQYVGSARNWSIFVNGVRICKLSNNKYLIHKMPPGNAVLAAQVGGVQLLPKKVEFFEIPVQAGEVYYLKTNIKASIARARVELSEVTERTFKQETQKSQLDRCIMDVH